MLIGGATGDRQMISIGGADVQNNFIDRIALGRRGGRDGC